MCELFGVSSPEKIPVQNLLREFFSHGDHHPDGWGLAFFSGNEADIEKQPINAVKSMYLKSRLKAVKEADNMIAHIRLATKGTAEYENTHPFAARDSSGRKWTLAHNGTIFESSLLDPMFYDQTGQTDSERILLYIIKQVNRIDPESADAEKRFRQIDRILSDITPENKVNLLLYDGELLYVHTNYRDSLFTRNEGVGRIFSTKPLDFKDWQPLPMNTPLAFRNGVQVFSGTNHGNEFFDSTSKIRHLYLDYAAL